MRNSSVRTPETQAKILEAMAKGQTATRISRTPGMPPVSTIIRWLDKDYDFRDRAVVAQRQWRERHRA